MKGFYLSAGLVEDPQHCGRIGPALWEFLWLISHETREAGRVLNGTPITAARIAAALGRHVETVKVNLSRLEREGYIRRARQRYGLPYEYQISNSKKWKPSDSEKTATPPDEVAVKTLSPSQGKHRQGRSENTVANKEVDIVDSKTNSAAPENGAELSLTPKRRGPKKTPLPGDFGISDSLRSWALRKGFNRLEERLEYFVGYAKANGKTYVDWEQAFQNSIRDDWAKINQSNGHATVKVPTGSALGTHRALLGIK